MPLAQHKNRQGIIARSKTLRDSGSMIERILWRELRSSPEQKEIKFRYQHPMSRFVVDFICLPARLIVEIDGASHDLTEQEDQERQRYFENLGYHVMRFSNGEVLDNVWAVADTIRNAARKFVEQYRAQDPSPKSQSDFDPPARGG